MPISAVFEERCCIAPRINSSGGGGGSGAAVAAAAAMAAAGWTGPGRLDEGAAVEEAAQLEEIKGALQAVAVVEEVLGMQALRRHLHYQVCSARPAALCQQSMCSR